MNCGGQGYSRNEYGKTLSIEVGQELIFKGNELVIKKRRNEKWKWY
jgi:hypothetical protein